MANQFRAFSVLGLGAIVAGSFAWTSGELQRFGVASPFVQSTALLDAAPLAAKEELSDLTKAANVPATPAVDQSVLAPTRIPAFDIVRVQPDGSMVIAGRAAPGAAIDIMAGDRIIGKTSTDESGSFAFVLDQPLPPGDYNIGLVARVNGETLTSEETAIVQIPNVPNGDVLAIVTAPNTAPEVLVAGAVNEPVTQPEKQAVNQADDQMVVAPKTPVAAKGAMAVEETAAPVVAAAPAAVVSADPSVPVAADGNEIRIEAVEIDGAKTFVAGAAKAGSAIRLYLGDTLLGEAKANDAGRFLVESKQPVPVGTQILRADSVDAQGEVTARASVPFERVDTDKLALVASGAPQSVIAIPAPELALNPNPPVLTKVDTSVIIRKGDTLWQIARRVYGKGVTFSTIYNANVAQITDPNRIFPGQIFAVPRNTENGEPADFEGIEGQKKENVIIR